MPCDTFAPVPVEAVERQRQILVELRAVGGDAGADLVEHVDRQAARVGRRLQHQRRHRADQHRLGDALGAVPADVARDFAAAGRMADEHRVLQVERCRSAPRGRRRRCPSRCRSTAGSSGHGRAGRARSRDSRCCAKEQHLRVPGVGVSGQPCEKTTGWPVPQSL